MTSKKPDSTGSKPVATQGKSAAHREAGGYIDDFSKPPVQDAISRSQELTRRALAIVFSAVYLIFLSAILIAVLSKAIALDDAVKVSGFILAPLATLVGPIVGFYFASRGT